MNSNRLLLMSSAKVLNRSRCGLEGIPAAICSYLCCVSGDEIPDEFFEVTEYDIRKMWQDLQKQT